MVQATCISDIGMMVRARAGQAEDVWESEFILHTLTLTFYPPHTPTLNRLELRRVQTLHHSTGSPNCETKDLVDVQRREPLTVYFTFAVSALVSWLSQRS
jgi:hypothetical protein